MKKSDIKRQAILDTAYRLFRTQGFDKTSVSEITAEVGGSKATIYNHFRSKEELFVECMLAAAENYMAGTLTHLEAASADPAVALFDFGKSFLEFHLFTGTVGSTAADDRGGCALRHRQAVLRQDQRAAGTRFGIHVRMHGIWNSPP